MIILLIKSFLFFSKVFSIFLTLIQEVLTLSVINDSKVFITLRVIINVKFTIVIIMFFNFILQYKKIYFVIYLIFVIESFKQRIREINNFCAIFNLKIVFDEN